MKLVDSKGVTRYLGSWRGRVSDDQDPKKQGRVRCIVPDVYGSSESPWALPKLPGGDFATPSIGDQVWVSFEQGDVDRPILEGYLPSSAGGALAAAPTMLAEDDETTALYLGRGGGLVEIEDAEAEGGARPLREPATTAQPTYPNVRGIRIGQTYIEVDGTPGQERIHLHHPSGAYYEIGATGQVLRKARGAETAWVQGQQTTVVTGQRTDAVGGSLLQEVKKRFRRVVKRDLSTKTGGNEVREIGGSLTATVNGAMITEVAGKHTLRAGQKSEVIAGNRASTALGNVDEVIGGGVLTTVGNKDARGTGYGLSVVLGDYEVETVAGSIRLKSAAGSLEIKPSGEVVLKNAVGRILMTPTGKFRIEGAAAEFLDLMSSTLDALGRTVVSTSIGLQPLSTAAEFVALRALLDSIKG